MTVAAPSMPYAERESGLVVPAHLAAVPETPEPDGLPAAGGLDSDNRRRIVLDRRTRKMLTELAIGLGQRDIAVFFHCRTHRMALKKIKDAKTGEDVEAIVQEPIPGSCGEIMTREGEGTLDPGFGCKCSRVHFLAR